MPKWLEKMASKSAKKAGLKPDSERYKAYKYTVIRNVENKEKKK